MPAPDQCSTRTGAAVVWAAVLFTVAGCRPLHVQASSPPADPPAQVKTAAPLKVIQASSHVTGLPYPPRCALTQHNNAWVPDPTCTPGSVRSDVTQATIKTTICAKGWATSVRPPLKETAPVKRAAMLAYDEIASKVRTTEFDHLVPLQLGGSSDVTNLWPEPSDLPGQGFRNTKDTVEDSLNKAVCTGKVQLADAQIAIAREWETAEQALGLSQ